MKAEVNLQAIGALRPELRRQLQQLEALQKRNRSNRYARWHLSPTAQPEAEGWLVTYLDLLTLLLVLLVVMLSLAGPDVLPTHAPNVTSPLGALISEPQPDTTIGPVLTMGITAPEWGRTHGSNDRGHAQTRDLWPENAPFSNPTDPTDPTNVQPARRLALEASSPASGQTGSLLNGGTNTITAAPTTPGTINDAQSAVGPKRLIEDTANTRDDSTHAEASHTAIGSTADDVHADVTATPGNSTEPSTAPPRIASSREHDTTMAAAMPTAALAPAPLPTLADLGLTDLGDDIDVIINQQTVSFRISNEILFESAQADLTDAGLEVIKRLATVVQRNSHRVTVEGHTDDRPIFNNRFPSNWELSTTRATSVLRQLQNHGVASDRLRAIGYADTRPIASNETPNGRAHNRRVELIMDIDPADVAPNTEAPSAEPVNSEPTASEAVSSERLTSKLMSSDPTTSGRGSAEPMKAEPVNSQSVNTEPVDAKPVDADQATSGSAMAYEAAIQHTIDEP